MLGSIDEEENLVYLNEYEKKFILGNVNNDALDPQSSFTLPSIYNNNSNFQQNRRNEILIDTDKIPAIKLFRIFKKSTSLKSSSNDYFSHIERKKLLSETFSTNHLFSSVLESASAQPDLKQIRTKNNRKKNVVDAVLLYDTKFYHSNDIDAKAKKRVKDIIRQKESVERKGSKTVHFSNGVEYNKDTENLILTESNHYLLSPQDLKNANNKNFNSNTGREVNIDVSNGEIPPGVALKPVDHDKFYNKFKRTKKSSAKKNKDRNESATNKVKFASKLNYV